LLFRITSDKKKRPTNITEEKTKIKNSAHVLIISIKTERLPIRLHGTSTL